MKMRLALRIGIILLSAGLIVDGALMNLGSTVGFQASFTKVGSLGAGASSAGSIVHDIVVTWDPTCLPKDAFVNEDSVVGVLISNNGTANETGLKVVFLLGGVQVGVRKISSLKVGSSCAVNLTWSVSIARQWNITFRADQVPGETGLANNCVTKTVRVSQRGDILIVSDDEGYYSKDGTSLGAFASALANYSYDVWLESVNGTVKGETLAHYKLVIWSCGDYAQWVIDPREEVAILSYFEAGGNVLLEGAKVISDLVSRSQLALLDEMLHVKWDKYAVTAPGIESVHLHPVTRDLTFASWASPPAYYPDGVETTQGGFAVMNYVATNFAAITVVDGSEKGTGSAIYLSFSVRTLSVAHRTTLIQNSVQWFNRFGVSVVLGRVLASPPHSVDFIYDNLQANNGTHADAVAGGMLYSLCENEQDQQFVDTFIASKSSNKLLCMFGSPSDHELIEQLNASGVLPVIICQDSNDTNHYQFKNSTSNALLYDFETGLGRSSLFIIQVFIKDDVTYLVVCGLDQQGMWASGMKLSRVVCRNLRDYCETYYIFEWANNNGALPPRSEDYQMQQVLSTND